MKRTPKVRQAKKPSEPTPRAGCESVSIHDDEWVCAREKGHKGPHESERSPGGTTAVWTVMDGRERGKIFPINLRGKALAQTGGWSSPIADEPSLADACPKCGRQIGEHDGKRCPVPFDLARIYCGVVTDDGKIEPEDGGSWCVVVGRGRAPKSRDNHVDTACGDRVLVTSDGFEIVYALKSVDEALNNGMRLCTTCVPTKGLKPKAGMPATLAKFKDDVVTAIGRVLAPGAKILGYPRHPAAALYPMIEDAELEKLAADIKANGLRDPIILISEGGNESILDGSNRGRACELAGVKPRFEYYKDVRRGMSELVDFVLSKNEHRRHLAPSVRAMIADNAARLKQGGQKQTGTGAGLTQAEAAKQHNVSERLVRQARVVNDRGAPKVREAVMKGKLELKAAEQLTKLPVAKQTEIAERALAKKSGEIKSGHVQALVRQEAKRDVVAKINTGRVAPLVGTFRLIVADPPWPYDNSDQHDGSRGHMGYPPMPLDAICGELAREVDKVAHDDCILGLWVPNAFIHLIGRVLDAWKFEHRTMITWGKDRLGMGSWARGKTEHLVIASRGKPIHTLNEIATLMMAPVREHSRKPDEIMDALAKHCPGPHLEMFAREERPGWKSWGAETRKFEAA